MSENPEIIAFVADLYFVVQIESVAQSLGFQVYFIENADQLPSDPRSSASCRQLPGEAASSRSLTLPALPFLDLTTAPWTDH
jgi:hypothetical protein